jgi:uncharacterized protein
MKKYSKAILFGLFFGFLLQKGGVAKYHILEGQLMLIDFTVMKVMLSAIIVGMIGFYYLEQRGKVKPHIKPAKLGANIIGGLLFGTGFALAGYCPGTGAAALGQGNLNAFYYMGGMLVGSYFYAEVSAVLDRTIKSLWNFGEITLPEVIGMKKSIFMIFFFFILVGVLFISSKL